MKFKVLDKEKGIYINNVYLDQEGNLYQVSPISGLKKLPPGKYKIEEVAE